MPRDDFDLEGIARVHERMQAELKQYAAEARRRRLDRYEASVKARTGKTSDELEAVLAGMSEVMRQSYRAYLVAVETLPHAPDAERFRWMRDHWPSEDKPTIAAIKKSVARAKAAIRDA